ncbi:Non-structural maintenance of chromosomes element 1 [Scenedesmus sp. NREL 46B-D3]|nr:Non-structural maintenance of chromosomes element 1 [Scenedesmus sp. NREL 46B-D3]
MRKGYMLESAALDTFAQLTGHRTEDDFHALLAEQNREMDTLGLQLRTLRYLPDSQTYVGLINTMSDEPSKLGTHYSIGQREFFKHVLEAIAVDPNAEAGVGAASGMQLLNMDLSRLTAAAAQQQDDAAAAATQAAAVAALRKLTKSEKEHTLKQLVADGWLRHSHTQSGHYCIGVRSFLELSDMLLQFDLPAETKQAWENII